jgi:hypothetical protein
LQKILVGDDGQGPRRGTAEVRAVTRADGRLAIGAEEINAGAARWRSKRGPGAGLLGGSFHESKGHGIVSG